MEHLFLWLVSSASLFISIHSRIGYCKLMLRMRTNERRTTRLFASLLKALEDSELIKRGLPTSSMRKE